MHKSFSFQLVVFGLMLCLIKDVAAVEHKVLEKYLGDDVVAVAYVDLSKIDTLGLLDWAEQFDVNPKAFRSHFLPTVMAAQERVDELVDFGVQYVYLLLRTTDIDHGGPTWVVPVAKSGSAKSVQGLIMSGRPDSQQLETTSRPRQLPEYWEIVDGVLLGGTTADQLEILKKTLPQEPRDFSEAWSVMGQGDCGLIIFGDEDSRRVVREMFPKLPKPFELLDGALIADGLAWGGVTVKLPPELGLEVVIKGRDANVASTTAAVIEQGVALFKSLPQVQEALGGTDLEELANALQVKVEGKRVQFDWGDASNTANLISKIFGPPIRNSRQAALRMKRVNQLKQLALGMLNYEASNASYPSQASYDENGKALLSWRVHILPFIEQNALYNQFHLDEPWDSEHNRKLIDKMPKIYADPDLALGKLGSNGYTTFVVPVGEGTVFEGANGTRIRDVEDGTSNTILIVEVVPERAVEWTKPADWEVDFNQPLEGVKRVNRESFDAAYCDGSVRTISNDIEEYKMRLLLTKADGEIID